MCHLKMFFFFQSNNYSSAIGTDGSSTNYLLHCNCSLRGAGEIIYDQTFNHQHGLYNIWYNDFWTVRNEEKRSGNFESEV